VLEAELLAFLEEGHPAPKGMEFSGRKFGLYTGKIR
jgi:hypothetical protein